MATFNKDALIERVYEFDNFDTKKCTREFVEDFLNIIADQVAEGNTVSLAGFGKFTPFRLVSGAIVPKFYAFEAFKNKVA